MVEVSLLKTHNFKIKNSFEIEIFIKNLSEFIRAGDELLFFVV